MGRPKVFRIVRDLPAENFFMPQKIPINNMPRMVENLTIVEFEALRLKHYEKLTQVESAKKMSVSQSTFSRILSSAHEKVTNALVEGIPIHLAGGRFNIKEVFLGYGCAECLYEWKIEVDSKNDEEEIDEGQLEEILPLKSDLSCPKCDSTEIYRLKRDIVKAP